MLRKTYQDLLRSSLQGDAKAFNEVVRRFHSMALALALRRLGNAASADDAVQEAFLTAFCKLSTLNDVDAFPSWLRAIVISCCNRLHRKQPGTIPLDDVAAHTPSDLPEPFEVMTRFQDRRMVLEILDGLSGVMRQACMLRYVQGQTYREIATLLGIPM
ncbi:MAG: RNA polymerase sigma factor, partial [Desulfovibrionales bacterium]